MRTRRGVVPGAGRSADRRGGDAVARRTAPSLVITALLALGLLFSLGGTGMAISGLASDTTAVQAQYPGAVSGEAPSLGAPAEVAGAQADSAGPQDEPAGDVAPSRGTVEPAGSDDVADEPADVAPARELAAAAGGGELPFTGLAAIPILGIGLVALAGGVILRRRTSPPTS